MKPAAVGARMVDNKAIAKAAAAEVKPSKPRRRSRLPRHDSYVDQSAVLTSA